jgi:hypothetical protein
MKLVQQVSALKMLNAHLKLQLLLESLLIMNVLAEMLM